MYPKNLMEEAVRETLARHRGGAGESEPSCWCPLCIADMQALALSSLPPRYVTRRGGTTVEPVGGEAVQEEVARAVQRVGGHPKHPPGSGPRDEKVAVVNFPFEVGFSTIEERMRSHAGACECWDCRCDAIAFALNRFPPQYGVAVAGRSTLNQNTIRQMAEDMAPFLDLGVQIAVAIPRHDVDR